MIQALTRKIRDRITISYDPPPGGTTVTDEMFISGIQHTASAQDFETKFTLESTTGRSPYFVLGIAKLGTTTKLGF